MAIAEDVRKTLTNPTPLYVAAGTADLAARKLRELPATVERLRTEAPERLPRLKEQAQSLALQGVGLALEYAVKARETYDELAERGRVVVETRRAGRADAAEVRVERADAPAPVTEPVTEPKTEPETGPTTATKPAPKTEPKAEPKAEAKTQPRAGTKAEPKTEPKTEPKAAAARPRKAAPRRKAGSASDDA